MLALTLTAWFLSSAQRTALPGEPPRAAVFHTVSTSAHASDRKLTAATSVERPPEPDLLRVWMDHLAVVKPHRPAQHAPPTLQMFIAPSTTPGGLVLNAFGRF